MWGFLYYSKAYSSSSWQTKATKLTNISLEMLESHAPILAQRPAVYRPSVGLYKQFHPGAYDNHKASIINIKGDINSWVTLQFNCHNYEQNV